MLPGVLLQPARRTNKLVRDHLNRTIFRTVELAEILRFHTHVDGELGRYNVWGVTPSTKSVWDKIHPGSIVAFYSERKFYLAGVIIDKFVNRELARHLWGIDSSGNTWEYIYLIDPNSLIEVDVDLQNVVKLLNYSENFILQRALYSDNPDLVKLFEESMESPPSQTDPVESVKREVVISTLKKYKRDPLFSKKVKYNYGNRCAVCGIPNEAALVEAAHVKPVHADGPDLEENGIALCANHHKLFDSGYITVRFLNEETGEIIISGKAPAELKEHLAEHENKRIRLVKTSKQFLDWHYRNIFKG